MAQRADRRTHDPWLGVTTYGDMLRLNVAFLNGQIHVTPYQTDSPDEETLPMLTGLINLHRFGLLTLESQPAEATHGKYIAKTWRDGNGKLQGKWYVDIEQRPYIAMMAPRTNRYMRLVRYLLERPNKFRVMMIAKEERRSDRFTVVSNFKGQKYVMSRSRASKRIEDLHRERWESYTAMNKNNVSTHFDLFSMYRNIRPLLHNVMEILVALRHYGKGDIVEELVVAMRALGMKPAYKIR